MTKRFLVFCVAFLPLLTACMTTQQNYINAETQCTEQRNTGLETSEKGFILCLSNALNQYGPHINYDSENIRIYNKDRMAIAEKFDAARINRESAEKQYKAAQNKFLERHQVHLARLAEQERVENNIRQQNYERFLSQQRVIKQQERYAQDCIRRYEASMPSEYDTNCYGGASPDGRNVVGYQNCTTSERRQLAPRYIVDQCFEDARQAVPLH